LPRATSEFCNPKPIGPTIFLHHEYRDPGIPIPAFAGYGQTTALMACLRSSTGVLAERQADQYGSAFAQAKANADKAPSAAIE
jgi:hypothetical protein